MDPPPSYTARVPQDSLLPEYTPPTTFTIGKAKTQGLITEGQVKGHLGLLWLFYKLRETVETSDDRLPVWATQLEPDRRWAWFVSLAAER
jgi:hypothetical protein